MNTCIKRLARVTAVPLSGSVMLCLAGLPSTALAQEATERAENSGAIIVTAQKREERLQDVPIPVTAVGGADLLAQNQTKTQEFFATVPGVNLQFQNNRAQLAIRGITTSPVTGNPVVGFVIDDVPYGSSTGQGGLFGAAPDIDPSELAQIEVLRGPQGTLYGASSIGGLVKYITIQPELGEVSGSAGAGVHLIDGGDSLGYNVRGAVNVPLGDTVAIRASGFVREDPGYIDNVRTGEDDVNSSRVTGGRLTALWEPSDSFALTLGAMYQERDIFGSSNVDAQTGSFYEQTDQIGSGRSRSVIEMYRGQIEADLGGVDLTSITGYSRSTNYDNQDFTASPLTFFLFPAIFPPEITDFGNVLLQTYDVDKFSHETRLAGGIGDSVDWIIGGFYTHEKGKYTIDASATNPANGEVYGVPVVWRDDIKYQEYAAFADFTVRLSDQFDVQFGGRYSKNDQEMVHREWFQGLPYPEEPFFATTSPEAHGSSFTYQVTPRFRPTPDHMIYGRLATGYRPGGPNAGCNDDPFEPVPCEFSPDKTVNLELGAKGDLAGGILSYDVSVFNIDWTDIQITQVSSLGTFTYNSNAGKARSRGFEIALEANPTDGLKVAGWFAYVDAKLLEGFASDVIYAAEGDRLPFSSKYSGRFAVDYETAVGSGNVMGSFGVSATYVGERQGEFVPFVDFAPLRASYPGYVQFDAHAGLDFDGFNVNLFVQNITNRHGVIGGGFYNQSTFNENWFNYAQPRTIGINVNADF